MQATDRLTARRFRVIAACTIATVSTAIAAAAHLAAGGGTASMATLALALVVSGAVGMLVVGPRLTRTRTAAGVILDQLVFHTLFAFFGASGASATDSNGGHSVDHGMLALTVSDAATNSPVDAMIVSHIGAALIAYAMLRRGATAITSILIALTTEATRALAEPPVLTLLPVPQRLRAVGHPVEAICNARTILPPRRGPPVFAVV